MEKTNPILVTGTAGFIGFHLAKRLLEEGYKVVGIDSVNDYYDVNLKNDRTSLLKQNNNYTFYHQDLTNYEKLKEIFNKYSFQYVVNLAAQAGVRYSLTNPHAYLYSNITSFLNIIECCKRFEIKHLVYASSSSVYGANRAFPFSVKHSVNHPLSLYAATKKSNELIAHSYSSSFGLPTTGLRFFSVYGPWGRPDMALFLFTKAILNDEPIDVFNNGDMKRDFTYVDDIVEGVYRLMGHIPEADPGWDAESPNPSTSFCPYSVQNIGNNSPVQLMDFISAIEKELGKKAKINFKPMQMADVPEAYADVSELKNAVAYKPETSVETGIKNFIDWYKSYHKV